MQTLTFYVRGAAIVLALAGLASRLHPGSERIPLMKHVIGAAIASAVILGLAWFTGGPAQFGTIVPVCVGFALGMLWMYIACVHVYKINRSKIMFPMGN